MEAALMSGKFRAELLFGLYRRLRRLGEEEAMIRRSLSAHTLETNLRTGRAMLQLHKELLANEERRRGLAAYRLIGRFGCALQRRRLHWRLLLTRATLRSLAALSDFLVMALMLAITFLFYQMYTVCRAGLAMADAKYKALAIPVMQTIEALEQAEQRRLAMKQDMEEDIVSLRSKNR